MRRRDFITSTAVALVATVIPIKAAEKPWQEMTLEELMQYILRKRQAGVKPNFEHSHHCPNCGVSYLCPDRYLLPVCSPTKEFQRMGYKNTTDISCSLCNMDVEKNGPAGYRELWLAANGV